MSASPDSNVEYFQYDLDLTVDPPAALSTTSHFACRRSKDEDVVVVDGAITVVSRDVTTVTQAHDKSVVLYDYSDLKRNVKALAKAAKDAGSKLNGQVVVRANTVDYFRLAVRDNVVKVESAQLSFPDGTTCPTFDD